MVTAVPRFQNQSETIRGRPTLTNIRAAEERGKNNGENAVFIVLHTLNY